MTIEMIAEKIYDETRGSSDASVMIAVEGFGGSGKTTVAETLRTILKDAFVVSIDDFIVKERLADASWDSGVFDRNRLEQQVLLPISRHQSASYQKLLWDTETLSDPVRIPDVKYIIVEGISSYHPDIAHYYDYKIWVHAPIEVAKRRGEVRDAANENARHWGVWANNDLIYRNKYHPEEQADFVFDNYIKT